MATSPVNGPAGGNAPAGTGHAGHGAAPAAQATAPSSFAATFAQAVASANNQSAGTAAPLGGHRPGHLAFNSGQHAGATHDIHERALALRARRLELLAANIANADTPGYKAVDLDVEEALRAGQTAETAAVKYRVPLQSSLDGNTVEIEVERSQFADAAIRYQFSLDQAIKHYMHISDLFKTLKD